MINLAKTPVIIICLMLVSMSMGHGQKKLKTFPYKAAGLSQEEAAAHLLSRFTYGYNANDVQETLKHGLERWFYGQLRGELKDEKLAKLLEPYADVQLDNKTLSELYPRNIRVRKMMLDEGYIPKDSVNNNSIFYREAYNNFLQEKGYRREQELYRQFIATKVLRSAFSANQLQEVMTDFWFNHFNVSFTKPQAAPFIPSYENHVIRPNALGHFGELLLATAKAPAMLFYLDNASSMAERPNAKTKSGINENYARELMELHTLGVDGGYSQKDVSEAARILTGWTVYPMNGYGNKNILQQITKGNFERGQNLLDGDFVFVANRHDKGQKEVLGRHFENDGYHEGVGLISYLSSRPETARFIAKKIAVRFVCDDPDEMLVMRMAEAFLASKGDIQVVLETMVYSPEFWKRAYMFAKVKTPFELAISSVRALEGAIDNPNRLVNWVTRMGEKKYYYVAPTGFPDRSSHWINTGALLNRMNFGLSFAQPRVSGVDVDLLEVMGYREPEGPEEALEAYARLLLPMADGEMLKHRLSPLLTAQGLRQKVAKSTVSSSSIMEGSGALYKTANNDRKLNNAMLAQVVGLIIGSPEFQRR